MLLVSVSVRGVWSTDRQLASIYSLGVSEFGRFDGHSAGPTIGMGDVAFKTYSDVEMCVTSVILSFD